MLALLLVFAVDEAGVFVSVKTHLLPFSPLCEFQLNPGTNKID